MISDISCSSMIISNPQSCHRAWRDHARLAVLLVIVANVVVLAQGKAVPASGGACSLLGDSGCKISAPNAEHYWPKPLGALSKSDCCHSCHKNKGCKGFQIKGQQCTLFGGEGDLVLDKKVKGAKCFKTVVKNPTSSKSGDFEPTEEQCQKHIERVCGGSIKNKNDNKNKEKPLKDAPDQAVKDKNDEIEARVQEKKLEKKAKTDKSNPTKQNESNPTKQKTNKTEEKVEVPKKVNNPEPKPLKKDNNNPERPAVPKKSGEDLALADPNKAYKGKYFMNMIGPGGCRGEGWDHPTGWPRFLGRMTLDACANRCALEDECRAVHVLRPDVKGDGKIECLLFAHKKVINVPGMGGYCYDMDDDRLAEEDEMPKIEKIDKMPKLVYLGKGRCRGPGWAEKVWPIELESRMRIEDCGRECAMRKRCLAFDLTELQEGAGMCALYGHRGVVPASAVKGECFTLRDRSDDARGLDDDEDDEDDEEEIGDIDPRKNTAFKYLGKGMCRGEGWASKYWPVNKGHVTFHECADYCGGLKGCRAFDVSNMIGHKLQCWLYHHEKVKPAASVPGKCFSVRGVKDKHKRRAAKAAKHYLLREEVQELKRQALRPKEDHHAVGSGMCRGPKWASKHWPQDLGNRGVHGCFKACQKSPGCTAFDVVSRTKKPVSNSTHCCTCLLYGHTRVIAASHAAPRPAECHKMVDHEPEDEVDPKHVQGRVRVKVIGEGACRGHDWQKGKWPLVRGYQTVDDCAKLCLITKHCKAFHIAGKEKKSKNRFECFLFGHKAVSPASGVPGTCYKAEGRVWLSEEEQTRRRAKQKRQRKIAMEDHPGEVKKNAMRKKKV